MDCGIPGFPVLHCLPEFALTHVRWVNDALEAPHLLFPPSPPVLNLSQHQGLFQWVSCLHQVAKSIGTSASVSVLPMNIQDWFPLGLTGLISLLSKGLCQESSPAPQYENINSSAPSLLYGPTLTSVHNYGEKTIALTRWTFVGKVMSLLSRFVITFSQGNFPGDASDNAIMNICVQVFVWTYVFISFGVLYPGMELLGGLLGGGSGKEPVWQCRRYKRHGFYSWVRKILEEGMATHSRQVFLPGEFHGQKSLADYSPWGCKELDMAERLSG